MSATISSAGCKGSWGVGADGGVGIGMIGALMDENFDGAVHRYDPGTEVLPVPEHVHRGIDATGATWPIV